MRALYLMRHASADAGSPGSADHARALTERGHREAEAIGAHIAGWLPAPAMVLCSSAVRAKETLERVRAYLPGSCEVMLDRELYLASPGALATCISEADADGPALLVIAHNPGIHQLALELIGEENGDPLGSFAPACCAHLELDIGSWAALATPDGVAGRTRLVQIAVP